MMFGSFTDKLIHMACYDHNDKGTDNNSHTDRPKILGNKVKISQYSHAGRYEKQSQVRDQHIGKSLDPVQLDPA